ncbi:uncharacterized protein EDB91DRAFT_1253636 [Suillus paluster]|uniref:uncharacterized protein n=1 Tax=Suillus paluster TaxID=48578 RepID=UPI001B86F2DA|nr:uncharacterized protein EDB91DRAFT_1253636 [Suillus paluster]KAG1728045.1 hypothetical protein EDB91DRAFT_1253636 [Suillus paluster]
MAPFCNPIFKDLFISQWFGVKGEGICFADAFKHIPHTTLALIATAVECALNSWHNGTRSQVKFSEMQFRARYQFYANKLERMQKDCPHWMKQFKKELYDSICKESGHELLAPQMDDEGSGIEETYADMEKSALSRMEGSSEGRVDDNVST